MTTDPEDVISIGNQLLQRYPDNFSDDFEDNRRKVRKHTHLQSQYVCNRVAGYITRTKVDQSSDAE